MSKIAKNHFIALIMKVIANRRNLEQVVGLSMRSNWKFDGVYKNS